MGVMGSLLTTNSSSSWAFTGWAVLSSRERIPIGSYQAYPGEK